MHAHAHICTHTQNILQTFPRPWTVINFVSILLGKLSHPLIGHDIKADICRVVLKLLKYYYETPNKEEIYRAVIRLLQGPPVLSTRVPYEKTLVMNALRLLFSLDVLDQEFAIVLMVHYIEGDEELKKMIMDLFVRHGLKDPLGYFADGLMKLGKGKGKKREGSTGTATPTKATPPTKAATPTSSTAELFSRSQQWLVHWMEEYHVGSYSRSSLLSIKPSK